MLSSGIPVERAPLGIRVMKHEKDYMSDKPGITTLAQLAEVRKVQAETKRIYSIMYSERFENRATVKAGELVKAGAIGQVIQTIGLGPHRDHTGVAAGMVLGRRSYGGILCDIGRTRSTSSSIHGVHERRHRRVAGGQRAPSRSSEVPGLRRRMVRGNRGTGYIRVDWFTPDGLSTWGDGRLTILGTDGYIEIRKNVDIGGRRAGATSSSPTRTTRATSTPTMSSCRMAAARG